ncbi:hypothetical protein ACU4GD_05420 [Cupriavidus basilensis]
MTPTSPIGPRCRPRHLRRASTTSPSPSTTAAVGRHLGPVLLDPRDRGLRLDRRLLAGILIRR